MEISSTRGGILAESTHETKTTLNCFLGYTPTSDNANLLDIMTKDRARRFLCYFLEQSAAMV